MAITVRRLRVEEWPLLRRLRLAALADAPQAFGQTFAAAAAQPEDDWVSAARASSSGDRRAWFVAFDGERAVGLVQGRRRPPHDCLVFSMWVEPSARRSGIGGALLATIDEWAAGWGGRRVVLWVVAGNDGALRFYERIGFRRLDAGEDVESGAAYGALAMSRPINRSTASDGRAGGDVG